MAEAAPTPLLAPPPSQAPAPETPSVPELEVLTTLGLGDEHRRRRWPWLLLALVLVGAAGAWMLMSNKARDPEARFEVAEVSEGDLTIEVTATGTLNPNNQVDVGPEVSGRVIEVLVDYNDPVEKGQLLARLDTEMLVLQVKQAQAQAQTARATLRQSEAALDDAKRTRERSRALAERKLIGSADLEAAEATVARAQPAVDVALAQVRTTRASLEMAQANLRRSEIRSPIDGMVIARQVEPGQVVIAALQAPVLFRLAESLEQMRLTADIDEADIGRIEEGQAATFTVAAFPEREFAARLTDVYNAPTALQQVVTYQALFDVENQDRTLRPGMTATVRITTATYDDVLTVPNAALRFVPSDARASGPGQSSGPVKGAQVWIETDEGGAKAVDVKALGTDGVRTIIEGEEVDDGLEVIVAERAPAARRRP
jgi:HlyD family secretion protein